MRQLVDRRFAVEVETRGLRFTCGHCLHQLRDGRCAHEWPNEDHRDVPQLTEKPQEVVFCKEFELR
jgi:hypothetical protein